MAYGVKNFQANLKNARREDLKADDSPICVMKSEICNIRFLLNEPQVLLN